jgi:hypothetical protein
VQRVRWQVGHVYFLTLRTSHGFTKKCFCTGSCPASISIPTENTGCAAGSYAIKKVGGFICVKFGTGTGATVVAGTSTTLAGITGELLTVTIGTAAAVTYTRGAAATSQDGKKLHALLLFKDSTTGVFFSECGPFVVRDPTTRKRALTGDDTFGFASRVENQGAFGDPHLAGAHGITFDVFGKPAANYSLLVAPAFEINMQLADRGPEMRFMTSMAVLYQGKSFVITPWTVTSSAELIAHFEALGAKVNIDTPNWIITIELCAQHTISFATRHSDGINFLNLEVRVPGCHNAYGGLLGQTYQCKYAHEKFEWSREREEAFRVATLETASGMYSPVAMCAHEDEYRGEAIRGGSFSNGTLSMTTML